ncbi:phenylacetate--CoA ligase family protein [Halovulum sp. GXIMD14793]
MSLALKLRMIPKIIAARRRNRWPRGQIETYQKQALRRLVTYASARSEYYKGLQDAPLAELPVLTRETLSTNWDKIVTDRRLTRDGVFAFLSDAPPPQARLLGRYRAMATSGSTGARMPFVYSEAEWAHVMASVARLAHWRGGLRATGKRLVSVVNSAEGSNAGAPMSWAFAHSLKDLGHSIAVIDQSRPLPDIIAELNRLQPDALSSFPSTLILLAEAQVRGELALSLQSINSSAEVLSTETALLVERAFGCRPHNGYAMTECGVLAATCARRSGLHLADDMTLVECVDETGQPVRPGAEGARVLITVLWSRTLPLIRYEVTDRLRMADAPCGCALPFPLIEDVSGRSADLIRLPGVAGDVPVLAWQVQRALYGRGVLTWQLGWSREVLHLTIVPDQGAEVNSIRSALRDELTKIGVSPAVDVRVETAPEISTEISGKLRRFIPLES